MGERTPLYDLHLALGAKMIDFSGWEMPLHYGSQVEEHHQVRRDCGVFDVSHMTVVDLAGSDAKAYLQRLLANDVERLKTPGKALYSGMLNERGGVVDDLIVYLTDAAASDKVATIDVPDDVNVPAIYAGVVVKASPNLDAAHAFLDWLAGPDGQSILAEFGFLPPSS